MAYIYWTKEQEEILKQNAGKIPYKLIGAMFDPPKTEASVIKKSNKLNLSSSLRAPRKYFHNENYWDTPNMENSYWAGFIRADGCIKNKNKQLTIETVGDGEHLELMRKCLGYTGELYRYKRQTSFSPVVQNIVRLEINCSLDYTQKLFDNFRICSNKTKRVELPNIFDELLFAYIKGYIDGDGDIGINTRNEKYKKMRIRIWSSAEESILKMKNKINNELLKNFFYKKEDSDFIYSQRCRGISFLGLRAAILFDYLSQLPTPCLDRKWKNTEVLKYVSEQKQKYPDKFIKYIPQSVSLV